jgi:GAF domain-containing protein
VTTRVVIDGDHPGRHDGVVAAARSRFMTAMMSAPLNERGHSVGGLNFSSASLELFAEEERDVAAMFACQASVVLANAVRL